MNRGFIFRDFLIIIIIFFQQPIFAQENDLVINPVAAASRGGLESFRSTVSLNFKNAQLVDILRLLAVQNKINILTGKEVSGQVNVSLTDVNLGTALDAILKVNGYDWFMQENIVVIKPVADEMAGELTTRIYKLEYVDAIAVAQALENVLTKKGKIQIFSPVSKGGLIGSGGGGIGGTSGGIGGTSGGIGGGLGGGQESIDHILVTDSHSNFPHIEKVIGELDKQVLQINIAVKFIETVLTENERLGIDWTARSAMSIPSSGGDESSTINIGKWKSLRIATLTLPVFTSLLEILSSDSKTRLIQEPQMTVKNNVLAVLKVGTSIPILVPQAEGGLVGTQPLQFQNEEIDITLSVLPRINEDKFISLDVQAVVQALVGYTSQGERPIVSERSAQTSIMVKDGETLLMGGLIFETSTETKTNFPGLSRIPIIKYFFKHESTKIEQRELLIFITPNIVRLS